MQKIYLGADHAGVALKAYIINNLKNKPYHTVDLGTDSENSVDYPDFAKKVVEQVAGNRDGVGILICGSGIGMSIAANRNPKIRAALCHTSEYAKLAREHNDANILVLGARHSDQEEVSQMVDTFLTTSFLEGRHQERVKKLADI